MRLCAKFIEIEILAVDPNPEDLLEWCDSLTDREFMQAFLAEDELENGYWQISQPE